MRHQLIASPPNCHSPYPLSHSFHSSANESTSSTISYNQIQAVLNTMPINFWTVGCLYGATSVLFGAFGAHGLKNRISDPKRIANWGTASQYQVFYQVSNIVPA